MAKGNVFFLCLSSLDTPQGNLGTENPPAISHYFNITAADKAATTSTSSNTSATSTAASSTTILPSATGLPSSTPSLFPSKGGRLSSGASAGIAVGVLLPVLGLLAAALWWCRRRQNKRNALMATQQTGGDPFELPATVGSMPAVPYKDRKAVEVGGYTGVAPAELESPGNPHMVVAPSVLPGEHPGGVSYLQPYEPQR